MGNPCQRRQNAPARSIPFKAIYLSETTIDQPWVPGIYAEHKKSAQSFSILKSVFVRLTKSISLEILWNICRPSQFHRLTSKQTSITRNTGVWMVIHVSWAPQTREDTGPILHEVYARMVSTTSWQFPIPNSLQILTQASIPNHVEQRYHLMIDLTLLLRIVKLTTPHMVNSTLTTIGNRWEP